MKKTLLLWPLLALAGCGSLTTLGASLGLTDQQTANLVNGVTTACKVDSVAAPAAAAVLVTLVPTSAAVVTAEQAAVHPAVQAACTAALTTP